MLHGKKLYIIVGVAVLLVALLTIGASATGLFAEEQAFIPADQVQSAIEAAAARQSGEITGAFVEREEGTNMVEVFIRSGAGTKSVEVDAATNQVAEV